MKKFERWVDFDKIKQVVEEVIENKGIVSMSDIFRELERKGYSMSNPFRKGYIYAIIDLLVKEGKAKETIHNRNLRLIISAKCMRNIKKEVN